MYRFVNLNNCFATFFSISLKTIFAVQKIMKRKQLNELRILRQKSIKQVFLYSDNLFIRLVY